jgi:hypothetical protein
MIQENLKKTPNQLAELGRQYQPDNPTLYRN